MNCICRVVAISDLLFRSVVIIGFYGVFWGDFRGWMIVWLVLLITIIFLLILLFISLGTPISMIIPVLIFMLKKTARWSLYYHFVCYYDSPHYASA